MSVCKLIIIYDEVIVTSKIKVAVHVCSLIIHELQAKLLCKHCIKTKRATMAQRQVTEAPRTVLLQQS